MESTSHQSAEARITCRRMHEAQSLCEKVPRRVEVALSLADSAHMVSINDRKALEAVLSQFTRFLISYLEQPQSLLQRICALRSVVNAVKQSHQSLDRILIDVEQWKSHDDTRHWQQEMNDARVLVQQQLKHKLDQKRLTESDKNMVERVLKDFKATTQLKRSIHMEVSDLKELDWMDTIYFKLFRMKKSLPKDIPVWFIEPNDVAINTSQPSMDLGSCGTVHSGVWGHGTKVTIRKLSTDSIATRDGVIKEADLWFRLNHPHVMKLFGACHVGLPFFVGEDAVLGHVGDYLAKPQNQNKFWKCIYETALGLLYLHSQRIVHGDLQCHNIRIGADGKAKLSNFSYSFRHDGEAPRTMTPVMISMRFRAPECVQGEMLTSASDVYSFGMCIIEARLGNKSWKSSSDNTTGKKLESIDQLLVKPNGFEGNSWQLLQRMCAYIPTTRPSIISVVDELNKLMHKELAEMVSKVPAKPKFCSGCGNSIVGCTNFCSNCGKRVADRPVVIPPLVKRAKRQGE